MKQLVFKTTLGPVAEQTIADFESVIGHRLPFAYRAFLIETNGGVVSSVNNLFTIRDTTDFSQGFGEVVVESFYSIKDMDMPGLQLDQVFLRYKGRVPKETVPIGDDPLGNLFLIGITGPIKDAVFFWDHDCEGFREAERDEFHNVGRLSNSFEGFIDALRGS